MPPPSLPGSGDDRARPEDTTLPGTASAHLISPQIPVVNNEAPTSMERTTRAADSEPSLWISNIPIRRSPPPEDPPFAQGPHPSYWGLPVDLERHTVSESSPERRSIARNLPYLDRITRTFGAHGTYSRPTTYTDLSTANGTQALLASAQSRWTTAARGFESMRMLPRSLTVALLRTRPIPLINLMDGATTDSEDETMPSDGGNLSLDQAVEEVDIDGLDFGVDESQSGNDDELTSTGNLDIDIQIDDNDYISDSYDMDEDTEERTALMVTNEADDDGEEEYRPQDTQEEETDDVDQEEDVDDDDDDDDEDDDYAANDDSMVDEYFAHLLGESESLRSDNPLNEHLLLSSSSQNYTRRNAIISSDRRLHILNRLRDNRSINLQAGGGVPLRRQFAIRCKEESSSSKKYKKRHNEVTQELIKTGAKLNNIIESLQVLPYKPRFSPLFPYSKIFRKLLSYLTNLQVGIQQQYLNTAMDKLLRMRRNGSWWTFQKANNMEFRSRKRKMTSPLSNVGASSHRSSLLDVRLTYHDQAVHIQLPPQKRKRTNEDQKSRTAMDTAPQSRRVRSKDSKLNQAPKWQNTGTSELQLGVAGEHEDKTTHDFGGDGIQNTTTNSNNNFLNVSSFLGELCKNNTLSSEEKEKIMNVIPNSHLANGSSFSIGGSGSHLADLNIHVVDYDSKTMEGTLRIHLDSIRKLIQVRQYFIGNSNLDSLASKLDILDSMTGVAERTLILDHGLSYLILLPFHGNLIDFKKNDLRFFKPTTLGADSIRVYDNFASRNKHVALRCQLMQWMKLHPFKQFKETFFLLILWQLKQQLTNAQKLRGTHLMKCQVLQFANDLIKYIEPVTRNFEFSKHQSKKRKIAYFEESKEVVSSFAASHGSGNGDYIDGTPNEVDFLSSFLNDGATEVFMTGRNNRHAFILRDPPPQASSSSCMAKGKMRYFLEGWERIMADSLAETLTLPDNCLTNIQWNYILFNLTVDVGDLLDNLLRIVIASYPESVIQRYRSEGIEALHKNTESCRVVLLGSVDKKSGKLELANSVRSMESRCMMNEVPECALPQAVTIPPVRPITQEVFTDKTTTTKSEDTHTYTSESVLSGYRNFAGTQSSVGGGIAASGVL